MNSRNVNPSLNNASACLFPAEEARACPKNCHWSEIMLGKISFAKPSAMLALLILGPFLGAALAQTESVLYSFCAQGGGNCTDGAIPYAGVVLDQKGNLYGTTAYGGAHNNGTSYDAGCGVAFKLTPKGKETVLHTFCSRSGCTDGANPYAGVVLDQKGNLYGTTYNGGNLQNGGVAFKLTPKGKETVLHTFCSQSDCTDGANPSGIVFDQKGNLYGTTSGGGAYGGGVVFRLTPEGKETVLYNFCARTNCVDGGNPTAGLVIDQRGNLYGTTSLGGAYGSGYCSDVQYGCGVVFKLTPEGTETVLHSFCAQGGENCTDGAGPYAGVVLDQKGNLYGTTEGGGNLQAGGVAFKVTPEGKETVLYSFCAQGGCTDGDEPDAGLVLDQKGNLYGTTVGGGIESGDCFPQGCGIVFRLTPKGKETVLYRFCTQNKCTDGTGPEAGLVFDQKGNLYGTTELGGAYNGCNQGGFGCGVIFQLTLSSQVH